MFFWVCTCLFLQTHYLGSPMGEGLVLLQIWKWYAVRLIYCVTFARMMKQSLALTIHRHTTVHANKHVPASRTEMHKSAMFICPVQMCKWLLCTISFVGTTTNHTNRRNRLRRLLLSQEVLNCPSDWLFESLLLDILPALGGSETY